MSGKYDKRHGGPYDRGSADSYYRRGYRPHYYAGGNSTSEKVVQNQMTPEEIEAYAAGYDDNEAQGNFKEWD
jgi:hypothetical protein